jgi:pyrroloquinoline quinone biosynthesis protein A
LQRAGTRTIGVEKQFSAAPTGAARTYPPTHAKEIFMQWTTPQACDFRFGFEITMYVAAR